MTLTDPMESPLRILLIRAARRLATALGAGLACALACGDAAAQSAQNAGAGLGLVSAVLMPYVLYYHPRQGPPRPGVGGGFLMPVIGTSMLGAAYVRAL